jgi:hypothetical protein
MANAFDITRQAGPIVVTLAYVAVYYLFQIQVMRVKMRLKEEYSSREEKFDRYFGQDREMLAADRIQLNTLEHMGPFLVLLWMNAVFVGPRNATIAGALYVVARGVYPFLVGGRLGRGVSARVMWSTGMGYAVLIYFSGALIAAMLG